MCAPKDGKDESDVPKKTQAKQAKRTFHDRVWCNNHHDAQLEVELTELDVLRAVVATTGDNLLEGWRATRHAFAATIGPNAASNLLEAELTDSGSGRLEVELANQHAFVATLGANAEAELIETADPNAFVANAGNESHATCQGSRQARVVAQERDVESKTRSACGS